MKNVNQRYFSRRLIRKIRVTTTFGTSTTFAVEKDISLYYIKCFDSLCIIF